MKPSFSGPLVVIKGLLDARFVPQWQRISDSRPEYTGLNDVREINKNGADRPRHGELPRANAEHAAGSMVAASRGGPQGPNRPLVSGQAVSVLGPGRSS